MENKFKNAWDDFLMERIGEAVADLKQNNERYRSAVSEYSDLVRKAQDNEITDHKQAFDRLIELGEYIRDTEYRYCFYTGVTMHKKMDDAAWSFVLPERFTE